MTAGGFSGGHGRERRRGGRKEARMQARLRPDRVFPGFLAGCGTIGFMFIRGEQVPDPIPMTVISSDSGFRAWDPPAAV